MPESTCGRGEPKVYEISCEPTAPPKQKSAGLDGAGIVEVQSDRIIVTVKAVRRSRLNLLWCIVAPLTVVCLLPLGWRTARWGIAAGLVWLPVLHILLDKKRVFVIDPRYGQAYGMKYPRDPFQHQYDVWCLELPFGKWLAIKALEDDDEVALADDLRALYGDRIGFERGRKERMGT